MLAMVSQKSMLQIGLACKRYEDGQTPQREIAEDIAIHLNKIISALVEADEIIDEREFDLWRGMAAGSQAQGSWQNTKGKQIEIIVQDIFRRRLQASDLISDADEYQSHILLKDSRKIVFADDPDIGVYVGQRIIAAIEVKGGIDMAGVLERVGAAIKSLSRVKEENPDALTILVMQEVSLTQQSLVDLQINQEIVNHWLTVEELLEDEVKRRKLFDLLDI